MSLKSKINTVVKRGHTEGIEREKISSQKSKEISLRIGGYLPSDSDGKYLQKMNAKCPQIPDEKKIFFF